jgi:hypothetical protein
MPYYMNVWRVYMLFIWAFFCFQASTALCIFMSTHANSWIKVAARQNIIWIRFGNRRAVRRRAEAGMALTAIGEFAQWGGVADCSGSRTRGDFNARQGSIVQGPIFCIPAWIFMRRQDFRHPPEFSWDAKISGIRQHFHWRPIFMYLLIF